MKRVCSFVFALLVFTTGGGVAEPAAIGEIRQMYSEIVDGEATSVEKIEFACEGDAIQGVMTIRRFDGDLMAVNLNYSAGDHGGNDQNFYFARGALFFVFETQQYWTFTGKESPSGESETVDRATQNRFYFDGGQCIRKLTRQVEATNPDDIIPLLGKAANTEVEPGGEAKEMLQRASALLRVESAADLERIFCGG